MSLFNNSRTTELLLLTSNHEFYKLQFMHEEDGLRRLKFGGEPQRVMRREFTTAACNNGLYSLSGQAVSPDYSTVSLNKIDRAPFSQVVDSHMSHHGMRAATFN